ncbi:MAG: hypothetical protein HY615_01430, partial [Candidatus Rokubacteria bacterium]|nr:hypothetical protein [Candidatus Rokubacteria bacterium]
MNIPGRSVVFVLSVGLLLGPAAVALAARPVVQGPLVGNAVAPRLSAAVRDLPVRRPEPRPEREINPRRNP